MLEGMGQNGANGGAKKGVRRRFCISDEIVKMRQSEENYGK